MTDRPIIMARGPMRNLLAGRKTQTRRPVRKPWDDVTIAKPDPHHPGFMTEADATNTTVGGVDWPCFEDQHGDWHLLRSPFGTPGDRLWVRETWAGVACIESGFIVYEYRADTDPEARYPGEWDDATEDAIEEARMCGHLPIWRPSIHMPRDACRMHLRVKRVWVERVQDVGPADIEAEGLRVPRCACEVCRMQSGHCPADASELAMQWRNAWNAHYGGGPYAYERNPLVWACEFEVER